MIDDYIFNRDILSTRETPDSTMAIIDDTHINLNISTNEEEYATFLAIESTDVPHSQNNNSEDPHEVTIKWNENYDWTFLVNNNYDSPLDYYLEKYKEFMENDKHGEQRNSGTPNVSRSSLNEKNVLLMMYLLQQFASLQVLV